VPSCEWEACWLTASQYLEIQREEAQGKEGLTDEEAPVGQLTGGEEDRWEEGTPGSSFTGEEAPIGQLTDEPVTRK
jgi:hypothetical protein